VDFLASLGTGETRRARLASAFAAFHDRGRIEPGRRADLVLVNGDPLDDITATRDIRRIWKRGNDIDRDTLLDHTQP
jgi:imidazolonepropionase-like amidohydrolase